MKFQQYSRMMAIPGRRIGAGAQRMRFEYYHGTRAGTTSGATATADRSGDVGGRSSDCGDGSDGFG